jgi:hypothetical protein
MHHAQSNHDQGQAATTMYQNTEPAKRYREVNPDTPLASPPPTLTAVSAAPTPPLRPPTLKHTSRLLNSIYTPSDHKDT